MIQEGRGAAMALQRTGRRCAPTGRCWLQQFSRSYLRIFRHQPYRDYILETIVKLMSGEPDDRLIYRKRLAPPGWPNTSAMRGCTRRRTAG